MTSDIWIRSTVKTQMALAFDDGFVWKYNYFPFMNVAYRLYLALPQNMKSVLIMLLSIFRIECWKFEIDKDSANGKKRNKSTIKIYVVMKPLEFL